MINRELESNKYSNLLSHGMSNFNKPKFMPNTYRLNCYIGFIGDQPI